jgi:hypothetical protein
MRLVALALGCLMPVQAIAAERVPVAIELVLALDSSASVNNHEFALQLDGLARAFGDPEVIAAIDALQPLGAAITIVQWGGPGETRIVVPFTHVSNGQEAKAFGFLTGLVRRWMRASSTSIATAINDGRLLLESNQFDGGRLVIDISGDGADNGEMSLAEARIAAQASRITINGLPIEIEDPKLSDYYRNHVILGDSSFVEPAADYTDFARAIKQKLLRELRPLGS